MIIHPTPATAERALRSVALPAHIFNRNHKRVDFDTEKIVSAIQAAGRASGEFEQDEARLLAAQVLKVIRHRFGGGAPHIEQIQDVVEQVLISSNYYPTARAYIIYREQHGRLRQDRRTLVSLVMLPSVQSRSKSARNRADFISH